MGGKYTEAQAASAKKYLSQFKEIRLRMKADDKKQIEAAAAEAGLSVNKYILEKVLPKK